MTQQNRNGQNSGSDKDRGVSKTLENIFRNFPGLATQTLAKAAGQSSNFFDMFLKAPEYMEQAGKAGRYLKDLREVAGLTVEDLGKAIEYENLDLLKAIEEGRSPITLDILFRLASFYSRNDPITFMMDFSKAYAPWLWQMLRFTGLEKLLITLERELKFINIYRAKDSARYLNNRDYERVLSFTQQAFDSAVDFVDPQPPKDSEKPPTKPKREATASRKPATATASPSSARPKATSKATGTAKPAPKRAPSKSAKPGTTSRKTSSKTTRKTTASRKTKTKSPPQQQP